MLLGLCLLLGLVAYVVNAFFLKPLRFLAFMKREGVGCEPFIPFVGQLPKLIAARKSDDVDSYAMERFAKHGGVWALCLGNDPRVAVAEASLAHEVLVTKSGMYEKSDVVVRLLEPLLGHGLVTSQGAYHKQQRRRLSPSFVHSQLRSMICMMESTTELTLSTWDDAISAAGGEVERNIHPDLSGLALNIMANSMLGTGFDDKATRDTIYYTFTSVLREMTDNFATSLYFPEFIHKRLPRSRRIADGMQKLENVVLSVITDRREGRSKSKTAGDDFLDTLLKAASGEDGAPPLTDKQVKDELMTFVLAGHETTSGLMSWTLSFIMNAPDVWAKLVDEADSVLGKRDASAKKADDEKKNNGDGAKGGKLTYEQIKKLEYHEAVLNEALRMRPPVSFVQRQVKEDHYLGDTDAARAAGLAKPFMLKKGMPVGVAISVLHRDRRVFGEDADVFRPERWLEKKRLPTGAFVPFVLGPRNCIGQNFARLEAKVMLSQIVQRFRMRLAPGFKVVPQASITIQPRHGVLCRIQAR